MIIDDNSNQNFLTNIELFKTIVVYSDYPKRAELLPYLYYKKYKIAEKVVIIHDSVFINSEIDVDTKTWKPIWDFEHTWDQSEDEEKMLKIFDNNKILRFHEDKQKWKDETSIITPLELTFNFSKGTNP